MKLQHSQLHIWHISTSFENYVASKKLLNVLSTHERQKAISFKAQKSKYNYIISHIGLRIVLSLYTNFKPKDLSFSINEFNKPLLESNLVRDLHFNLSHSNEIAIIGLYSLPVGVDIEFIDSSLEFTDIANSVFAENELKLLYIDNSSTKHQQFFKLWTKKEAMLKALGTGINNDLKSIDVSKKSYLDKYNKQWQIENIKAISSDYISHVAYQSQSKKKILHFHLSFTNTGLKHEILCK